MGLWDDLLSFIGLGDDESSSEEEPRPRPRKAKPRGPQPGDICSGSVEYVSEKFAKVEAGSITAVVFLGEMADHFVESSADVLHETEEVEFVLLEKGSKGWVASIIAVGEAQVRAALASCSSGVQVEGKITQLQDRYVIMDAGDYEVWIPISEISWQWLENPAESISLGDVVTAEIIRVELPDGWLKDKRKRMRRAHAVGSLRACLPQPKSPLVPMAVSCLPFKLFAVAKAPRTCDQLVLYVLEELVSGRAPEQIQGTTGLPRVTLDSVREVLTTEGFVKEWKPRAKGKRLAEALALARHFNAAPPRGFFASTAHPSSHFLRQEKQNGQAAYPRGWPRPAYNKKCQDRFVRATDEALPELMIDKLVSEDQRELLARLMADSSIRVFMRRDGKRPWKPAYIPTPEHWILAGLWRAFDSVGTMPFRPATGTAECRDLLLLRTKAIDRANGDALETILFEPSTATLWVQKDAERVSFRERRKKIFPELPSLGESGLLLSSGRVAGHLEPDSWCVVSVG